MAAASRPPSTASYRMTAQQKWSKTRLRRRPAWIRRSVAASSRSSGLVTGVWPWSAAQEVVPARPWPPRAVPVAVREEGEPGDVEVGLEARQVGVDGVERRRFDVLPHGDVRVVREAGGRVQPLSRADRRGEHLALA